MLFQIEIAYGIHVIIGLVLAAHTPDECVIAGGSAAVYGPAGADDSLLVMHDDMSGLLGLTHEMEYHVIIFQLKIEVNFHSSLVGM